MELEGKRSSISSMIAASVLVTLITLSTLTIGTATPATAQQGGGTPPGASTNGSMWTSGKRSSKSNCKS